MEGSVPRKLPTADPDSQGHQDSTLRNGPEVKPRSTSMLVSAQDGLAYADDNDKLEAPLQKKPESCDEVDQSPLVGGVYRGDDIPCFPHLSNNPPTPPDPTPRRADPEDENEEPAIAKSFERSGSPRSAMLRNKGALYKKVGEEGVCRMHKFSLYETATRYYMVGGDIMDQRFRILKIDRTAESGDLSIAEDDIIYTKKEMNQLLNAVDDGNKITGGLKLRCSTWGLLGFIRFTDAYYMLLITKRSQVAMVGGHYIYQIDGTELVPLTTTSSSSRFRGDHHPEEARFVGILNNLDLSRSFYFSYSYDITRSLQHNIFHERQGLQQGQVDSPGRHQNAMFIWNHHLLNPAVETLKNTYDWCLPIIHGFVDQASALVYFFTERPPLTFWKGLSIYGRTVYITIIARRSRFFAGARFLKRGANDLVRSAAERLLSSGLTAHHRVMLPMMLRLNRSYQKCSLPLSTVQDQICTLIPITPRMYSIAVAFHFTGLRIIPA